ncbi:MAG: hypothetical protein PHV05_00545 [Candidatus Riflebacteria bacterium]|nr:hypothetical protein [Candidatus Riflebacteria bacterium]
MLNKKWLGRLFLKVTGISFLLTLLLAFPYISRKAPVLIKSFADKPASDSSSRHQNSEISTSSTNEELEQMMRHRKASEKQLKPAFNKSDADFFSANKAFSLDFHKLPVEFLVPQPPETIRKAVTFIKMLKEADHKAFEIRQSVIGGNKKVSDKKEADR